MPWTYHYDRPSHTIITTSWDTLSEDDLTSGFARLVAYPDFRDDCRWFGDHVDVLAISEDFNRNFKYADVIRRHRGRRCFLMFSPKGSSYFERMLRSLNSEYFRAF